MKRLIAWGFILLCMLGLVGCGGSGESHTIEFTIPAGCTDAFVFSDVEISPQKNTLKISAGAGIASTEIIIKKVEGADETNGTPVTLKQREPVKVSVEKGMWYKIGVAGQNPNVVPMAVEVKVENADVRIR